MNTRLKKERLQGKPRRQTERGGTSFDEQEETGNSATRMVRYIVSLISIPVETVWLVCICTLVSPTLSGRTGNRRDVGGRGTAVRDGLFKLQRGREEAWMTKREELAVIGKALDVDRGNNVFKANFTYTSDVELSVTIEERTRNRLGFRC